MLRYRKLWAGLAGIVILLVLVGSFLKPDLVTVVPNESQLNREESDLHIQDHSNQPNSNEAHKPSDQDSTDDHKSIPKAPAPSN